MTCHVFTYGSLMFPEVWERVVRGRYRSAAAELPGHARFALAGETYPGVVLQPGSVVRGVLYFDVDAADLAALDAFEGEEYQRTTVTVDADGQCYEAGTYLYLLPQKLSAAAWEPESFQMQRFLDTYCKVRLG
ncbi:gamma-glutamylcyclotransferase [Oxalobacteraceae bacterium OM1]|nr:gamma-glutamylcyclotransferase [Oxalobacteraceae bacterium OM1]